MRLLDATDKNGYMYNHFDVKNPQTDLEML